MPWIVTHSYLTTADAYQYLMFFFIIIIFFKLNLANLFIYIFLSGSDLGVDSFSYAHKDSSTGN